MQNYCRICYNIKLVKELIQPNTIISLSPVDVGGQEAGHLREKAYAEAVDALPFGVVLCDENCHIARANLAAQEMFNFRGEQMVGHHFIDTIFSTDQKRFNAFVRVET